MEGKAFEHLRDGMSPGDTDALGVITRVRTGVERFVAFLGEDAFYGFVRDTTIPALLLRIVTATIAERAFEPVIVPAFHVRGRNGAREIGADDDDTSQPGSSDGCGEDPVRERLANIRKYIRAVNFQLLQIVRPDRLFANHNRLPRGYLLEYIERQEHFSAANLIRSLAAPDVPQGTPQKWLVTTRTCPEISQLPVLADMQQRLVADFHGACRVAVLSLASFTCGAHVTEAMVRAVTDARGHPLLLVLVADRSELRGSVINFAVRAVDTIVNSTAAVSGDDEGDDNGGATESKGGERGEAARPRITAVILQHYPSELGTFKALCTVAHLNGWEFAYVDALGLDFSGERDGDDARPMLAAAFGLRSLTPASLSEELRPAMERQLVAAVGDISLRPLTKSMLEKLDCPATAPALFGAPRARVELAQRWLSAHPCVLDHCLELATGTWTRVLRKIMARAEGVSDAVDSVLQLVHDSLAVILRGVARHTILDCAAAYGLESLIAPRYGGCGDDGVHEGVVRAGLAASEAPSDEVLRAAALKSKLSPSVKFAFAPRLPFFHRLVSDVAAARARVQARVRTGADSDDAHDAHVAAMQRVIDGSRVAKLVSAIDAMPAAWPDVLHGLCGIVLNAWACTELELGVLARCLEMHMRSGDRSVVRAVFVAKQYGTAIVAAVPVLAPLRHLRPEAIAALLRRVDLLLDDGEAAVVGGGGRHNRELLEGLKCKVTCVIAREAKTLLGGVGMKTEVMRAVRDVVATVPSAACIPAACRGEYLTCWLVRHAALWLQGSVDFVELWDAVSMAITKGDSGGWGEVYEALPACVNELLDGCTGAAADDAAALVAEAFRFMLGSPLCEDVYERCARDLAAVAAGASAPGGATGTGSERSGSVGTTLLTRLHPRMRLALWQTLLAPPPESPAGTAVRRQLSVALEAEARAAEPDASGLCTAAGYIVDAYEAADRVFAAAGDVAADGPADRAPGRRGTPGLAALVYAALSSIARARNQPERLGDMEGRLLRGAEDGALAVVERMELAVRYIEATAAAYTANATTAEQQGARSRAALVAALEVAREAVVLFLVRPANAAEWSPAVVRGLLSTGLHRDALCITPAWHVPAEAVAIASPTRTVCSVLRDAPWGAEYAVLARVVRQDGDLRGPIGEWIAAQPAGESLRTRALLFLAPLHERFNAKQSTPGLFEAVQRAAAVLGFTDAAAAARAYELLGRGPHDEECSADAGVRFFFSRASFEGPLVAVSSCAIERGHLGVLMATMLALQKERSYYAACFFAPATVLAGHGLGSDMGTIPKVRGPCVRALCLVPVSGNCCTARYFCGCVLHAVPRQVSEIECCLIGQYGCAHGVTECMLCHRTAATRRRL